MDHIGGNGGDYPFGLSGGVKGHYGGGKSGSGVGDREVLHILARWTAGIWTEDWAVR